MKFQAYAFCLSLLLPLAAHAADEVVPNVAMMSLIGDSISTELFTRTTGSKLQGNRKVVTPVDTPVLDVEAVQAANAAFLQQRPGVKTTLLVTQDKGLYQAQDALFDSADDNKDNRAFLASLLKNRGVTQLILITKHRSSAEFRLAETRVGSGRLEGLGYYVDNELSLINTRSLVSGTGFVAAYVYVKLRLVDAATLNVQKELIIKESDLNPNYQVTTGQLYAWDALTSEKKVQRLNEVIKASISEAIPKLLKP